MTTTGQRVADAVGEIFGIDPTLIFHAEFDPRTATITRGVYGTDGRAVLMRTGDGDTWDDYDAVRVVEEFDMNRRLA